MKGIEAMPVLPLGTAFVSNSANLESCSDGVRSRADTLELPRIEEVIGQLLSLAAMPLLQRFDHDRRELGIK
jgi:hypothetical protein